MTPLLRTDIPGRPVRRGKVRDIYDLGDHLLLVAPTASARSTGCCRRDSGQGPRAHAAQRLLVRPARRCRITCSARTSATCRCRRASIARRWPGGACWCRKTQVVPIECVVRGYLVGLGLEGISAERDGLRHRAAAGAARERSSCRSRSSRRPPRPRPGTTRTSRSRRMCNIVGHDVAEAAARRASISTRQGAEYALEQGIIIADTKFEFGRVDDELILIDEVLTPDSSRFWPAGLVRAGPGPAVVRQAVRPRLAGDAAAGTRTARRRNCRRKWSADAREVHRSLRAADGASVSRGSRRLVGLTAASRSSSIAEQSHGRVTSLKTEHQHVFETDECPQDLPRAGRRRAAGARASTTSRWPRPSRWRSSGRAAAARRRCSM